MTDHSNWSPSSASIWLNCPASVELSQLYKEDDSAASNLGTIAHGVLEDALVFGIEPKHDDIEIVEGVEIAVAFAHDTLLRYPGVRLHVEQKLEIPNTPVWGTADNVAVGDDIIHVADYKHGWVPVEVEGNSQLQTYLLGAIAKFGPRTQYRISVIQPRYFHKDGPVRTAVVSHQAVAQHQERIDWALANPGVFKPGKHCKYCKARGACKALAEWIAPRLATAMEYDITDRHTFDNNYLARLLDFLDLVPGYRDAVRQEAFKRALQDRNIGGYKIVKGNAERKVVDEAALRAKYDEWGIPTDALYEASLVSPLTIEKHLKARFKSEGRGKWKDRYSELENTAIQRVQGGLTLVRDVDGRPQFNKGDEFGPLPEADGDIIL